MNEVLLSLYELQRIDSHIDELVASRGELPARVSELRTILEDREAILKEIESRIETNDAEVRKITGDTGELREKLELVDPEPLFLELERRRA